MFGLFEKKPATIEDADVDTIIIHKTDGTVKRQEYRGHTEYDHQECAADYLCQPEKQTLVEIKDSKGKVFRYDQVAMVRLGWS